MASLRGQQPRDWYEGNNENSHVSTTELDLYEAAKTKLFSELSPKECQRLAFESTTSAEQLASILQEAKSKYESKPASKARKWLSLLSSRLIHYGTVLDVLVQQYPQYVSLAWGAMKFLFMSVINHEEMTKELAKAYSMIADLLPRTEFTAKHYPTPLMKEAIAHLYAHLILFSSRAINWYKRSKMSHALSAIGRPWALNWKDSLEDIAEQSRRVERLASVAAQAEIRDTRLGVVSLRSDVEQLRAVSTQAFENINRLLQDLTLNNEQIYNAVNNTQDLVQELQPGLKQQNPGIIRAYLSEVLNLSWVKSTPHSDATLQFCIMMRKRRRTSDLQVPELETLNRWASNRQSQLLFITSQSLQASKDLTIDLAKLLCASQIPAIWAFRYSNYWESKPTYKTILQTLTLQSLQLFPSSLGSGPRPISAADLQETASEADWLKILARVLKHASTVYIIFDAELLALAGTHNRYRITRWIEHFMSEMPSNVALKIFLSSTVIDKSYISREWEEGSWSELVTDFELTSKKTLKCPRRRPLSREEGQKNSSFGQDRLITAPEYKGSESK